MKILIYLSFIVVYFFIGYLIFNIFDNEGYQYDPISDEVLSIVLIWPLIVLLSIIMIIGYYGTILFVRIYRGIKK